MQFQFTPEVWLLDRMMFLFRLRDAAGIQWDFGISQFTLNELEAGADRQATFNRFRPNIHAVAQRLVSAGGSSHFHALTAAELKQASLIADLVLQRKALACGFLM